MASLVPPLLREKILQDGPLRFDHFMATALYHPHHGFYSSGKIRTGTQGDFLTPVSAGPVLGQLLARQADELHAALGRPHPLLLCEQGADRGLLAHDLLHAISLHHPKLLSAAQLHLLEPIPALAAQQRSHLTPFHKTTQIFWHENTPSFPPSPAPVFFYSCELLDSFPVRLARFSLSSGWQERFVTTSQDSFSWIDLPAPPDLQSEIRHWRIPEIEGFTAEFRPSAKTWIHGLAQQIQQGLILTLDYGMPATDLYHPTRPAGTLTTLQRHAPTPNPLTSPGDQDITSHVNFTELTEVGEQDGLTTLGLVDFSNAWTRLATPLFQDDHPLPPSWTRNFQHLTHPAFFGKSHHVLLQAKNLPADFTPSIARPAAL